MTKLKTLKDLIRGETEINTFVYPNELKQEAIKWVKYYQKKRQIGMLDMIWWIKHFFNITEDDLK